MAGSCRHAHSASRAGCRDVAPTSTPTLVPTNTPNNPSLKLTDVCARSCSLTDDGQTFVWAKNTPSDAAGASLSVARIRVGGSGGATLTLAMEDTATVATSTSATSGLVLVRVNASERRYSLAQLARGVTVHDFATPDTATIEYRILR